MRAEELFEAANNRLVIRKMSNKEAQKYHRMSPIPSHWHSYGAFKGKEIVGGYICEYTNLHRYLPTNSDIDDVSIVYLSDLGVEDEHRGKGIGAKLLKNFIKKDKSKMHVLITDRDSKSYPLYIRNGFVDVGDSVYGGKSAVLVHKDDLK